MRVPLQEDEYEALLELGVVGPVKPGRFEHPSVTAATELRLLRARLIELLQGAYVLTPEGRQILRQDSAYRSRRLQVIDGTRTITE
jgi:hypothetical protein